MPTIEVPGVGDVEFPDDMNDEQIAAAIKRNIPQSNDATRQAAPRQESLGSSLKRGGGLVGRAVVQGAGSLPLLPLDAGIAMGNLINRAIGQDEIPYASQKFDRALTQAGFPEPRGFTEKAGSLLVSAATGAKLPVPAPQVEGAPPPGFVPPQNDAIRQATLAKGRQEGLVVPPATTNPSVTNKILESVGGKIATQQDASLKNQSIFNDLAKRAIGTTEDLTQETLRSIRQAASAPNQAIRQTGIIQTDDDFARAISDVVSKYKSAGGVSKELAKTEIADLAQSFEKEFPASDAIDAVQVLRDRASSAYAKGDPEVGKAYRAMSKALEDQIERHLTGLGKSGTELLKSFRDGRQLLAKTYSVEKALNSSTGNIQAMKLATQLKQRKPLSGELETIARFAQAFPKVSQEVLDSGSVRNTDVLAGAATAALSREPSYLLYPFVRQGVRAGLLSNAGQSLAAPGSVQFQPSLLYGSIPATQGLFK